MHEIERETPSILRIYGYICQFIHISLKCWKFHVPFHAIKIVLEVYLVFHIMYAILTELKILKNKFQSYIYNEGFIKTCPQQR